MIKILIAEHNKHDLEMILTELKRCCIDFVSEAVHTESSYKLAIENFIPDVILCDYTFPSFDGRAAFEIREELAPDIPFILVSGTIGEENSIEMIKNGVTDFVLKDKIFSLTTKLTRALKDTEERIEKKRIEQDLKQSVAHLAEAQNLAKLGSWDLEFATGKLSWSDQLYKVFDTDRKTFTGSYDSFINLVDKADHPTVEKANRHARETGDKFVIDFCITTSKGEKRVIQETGHGVKDATGKVIRLFGTAQDITESKKTAAAINKAYDEKNAVLESIDDGFFATDANSVVTYWNRQAELLLDVKKELILGKDLHEMFARGGSPVFYEHFVKAITQKSTVRFEGFSDRSKKWFAVSAFASDNGLSVYFRDITEQKNDEEKLKESELRYRSIIEQATDAICIADASLKIIDINPYGCQMLGYSKEEFLKLTIHDLFVAEDLVMDPINLEALGSGNVVRSERRFKSKAGGLIAVEMSGRALSDGRLIVFGHDITERRKAQDKLKESENRYRQIVETAQEGIWLIDDKNITTFVNDKMCEILEYPPGEMIGRTILEFKTPEAQVLALEHLERRRKGATEQHEAAFVTKTGRHILTSIAPNPLFNEAGIYTGALAMITDITESKKAEERNKFQATLLNTIGQATIGTDIQGKINFWNKAATAIYGWTEEEAMGKELTKRIPVQPPNEYAAKVMQELLRGTPWSGEMMVGRKDGSYFPAFVTTAPVYDQELQLVATVGVSSDITERKKAEQLVQESEAKYRTLFEQNMAGVYQTTTKGVIMNCNNAFAKMLKYDSPAELLKINASELYFNPGERTDFTRILLARKYLNNYESVLKCKDGSPVYLLENISVWKDAVSGEELINGVMIDITEKKQAELLLKESNERYNLISKATNDMVWDWDLVTGKVYRNKEGWKKLFRIGGRDINHETLDAWNERIHPEDQAKVMQVEADIQKSDKDFFEVECRVLRDDGTYAYIHDRGNIFRNARGKPVRLIGATQDITERKKAETAVLNALTEKNMILESIGDAFFAVDEHWTVTYWNNHAEAMRGILRKEILGRNLWDVFKDRVNSESYIKYHEAIATKKVARFEAFYEFSARWYEVSAYPSQSGLAVYFKDITQRKQGEMQLIELNANLQQQAKELAISNLELEQFAYVASHDLQEPLRMITSFLAQLEKKYASIIDDRGKQYIDFAVDGAKRMRQIILDLLEFSRVGRTDDAMDQINLNEQVEEIKILLRKQIQEKNAVIVSDDLPIVTGYRSPVRQVFQNLISNALKFVGENEQVQININCIEYPDHWQFAVRDNGIGIEQEYFDKIFIIFQRLHSRDEFSGTGMGLAITKKIVENLGGKIWVESTEGLGSTFYFTLLKQ